MLSNASVKLCLIVIFTVLLNSKELFSVLRLLLLRQNLGDPVVNKLVSSMTLSILSVLDHEVGELVNVTRCLEYFAQGHVGTCHFEHIILENKVLSP